MAEVLLVFSEPIKSDTGLYDARVCGGIADDGLWEGWVEFRPAGSTTDGDSGWTRSGRETEQPNIADLRYWAGGLSKAYLEGALSRALRNEGVPITHTDILAATQEYQANRKPRQ